MQREKRRPGFAGRRLLMLWELPSAAILKQNLPIANPRFRFSVKLSETTAGRIASQGWGINNN
jgi:hypothetical protein